VTTVPEPSSNEPIKAPVSGQLIVDLPPFTADRQARLRTLIENSDFQSISRQLRHAAYVGMDPALFHPDRGRPPELALARCFGCPARMPCLALAFRTEDPDLRTGWYGGLGPSDLDAVADSLNLGGPEDVSLRDPAVRAEELRMAGWTVNAIAAELGCSRRTVQRYLRRSAA
jgi:AraC-like DNA-binding protein